MWGGGLNISLEERTIAAIIATIIFGISIFLLKIILFFFDRIYLKIREKITKKSSDEIIEKRRIKNELIDLKENKDKIIEKNTNKRMTGLGLKSDQNWQEYYKIRAEEEEKIEKEIYDKTTTV